MGALNDTGKTGRGPAKDDGIRSLFDSIAPDYDSLNHILSLGVDRSWRRRALKEIVRPGVRQRILDLACGTGDFSIAIARKLTGDSRVTGVDLSEGMLKEMRKKVASASSSRRYGDTPLSRRISAEVGNAEALRFEDASFDCVTIAFGVRNFQKREQALAEILRVLEPAGRLVILELSMPESKLLYWPYKFYFTKILPLIGGFVSGDSAAYRYLPASVLRFPSRESWMATMSSCGFRNVTHKQFSFGICRMYVGEK